MQYLWGKPLDAEYNPNSQWVGEFLHVARTHDGYAHSIGTP